MQNDNTVCVQDDIACASKTQHFVNLADMADDGKIWDVHKIQSLGIAGHFKNSGNQRQQRYAERIKNCSDKLGFTVEADIFKLNTALFCRVRTCPICQWRKSLMWKAKFYEILPKLVERHPNGRWLFLTLTVKNCHVTDLRETIKAMNHAWRKLALRKEFKDVLGWVRTTEITRNEADNTAHPHFHVLLLVKSGYFGGNYVTQSAWTDAWQGALKCPYKPIVNVKAVRKRRKKGGTQENAENASDGVLEAAIETLKYAVKPADMLGNKDWFLEMASQTFKLRFIATGGVLKDFFKDVEPDESGAEFEPEKAADDLVFEWLDNSKNYII